MTSEICVPVKVDGRVVGTINIESTADRPDRLLLPVDGGTQRPCRW